MYSVETSLKGVENEVQLTESRIGHILCYCVIFFSILFYCVALKVILVHIPIMLIQHGLF